MILLVSHIFYTLELFFLKDLLQAIWILIAEYKFDAIKDMHNKNSPDLIYIAETKIRCIISRCYFSSG